MRWFYAQADRVYVPTRATAEGLLLGGGIDPARIAAFGRGTDTARFGPERRSRLMRRRLGARGGTVLLDVGRLSPEKGLFLLTDAFGRASAGLPGLRLALVGEGPAREGLARALAGMPTGSSGRCGAGTWRPPTPRRTSSAPVGHGALRQVVTEAAASGLPAVVLGAGAAAEHVADGETGPVVPADDPAALAAAIARLAGDAGLRATMGARARARALRRPGWPEVLDGLLDGYAGLAGGEPPPGGPRRARRARRGGVRVVHVTQWYSPTSGHRTYLRAKAEWAGLRGLPHAAAVTGASEEAQVLAESAVLKGAGAHPERPLGVPPRAAARAILLRSRRWGPTSSSSTTPSRSRARSPAGRGREAWPSRCTATPTSPSGRRGLPAAA